MARWLAIVLALAAAAGGAAAQTAPGDQQQPGQPGSDAGHPTTPIGQPATQPGHPTDQGQTGGGDNKAAPPAVSATPDLSYTIEKLGKPSLGLGGYGGYGGSGGSHYGHGLGYGGGLGLHHEDTGTGCKVAPAGGWMQPVQGVFQDDPAPQVTYDYMHGAKPNPVINQVSPGVFTADLPMIAARKTVMMGVQRFRTSGGVEPGFTWFTIVFNGIGNCDVDADVKFRLRLTDINGSETVWTSPAIAKAPIHGSPGAKSEPFQVLVPAYDGLPPRDVGAFSIPGPGPYTLTAELLDAKNDEPTGLKLVVSGQVVSTDPPVVEFVPVTLSGAPSAADTASFQRFVLQVAAASNAILPDYFPTFAYGLPTYSRSLLDLSDLDPHESSPDWNRWHWQAAAADRLGAAGALSGATRVVGIVRQGAQGANDFAKIAEAKTAAMTPSTKAIFVGAGGGADADHPFRDLAPPTGADGYPEAGLVETVGHELNHSEPDHIWSGDGDERHNEKRDCGIFDHNLTVRTGHGERITIASEETKRIYHESSVSMMGPAESYGLWITQCAYAHLIYSFGHGVDPKVLFVRTILSNRNRTMRATLPPSYDQLGEIDAVEGPAPDWAIVVRQGAAAKTYPIEPHWFSEEDAPRDTLSLMAHIPDPDGAATLEVVYKGRVLASRQLAAQPPALAVTAPATVAKGATVHLTWTASAASGDPVLSSVFYSTNKGRWYVDTLFESRVNQGDVVLDAHAKDHVIKVVVTDGGRSSERLIRYSTP